MENLPYILLGLLFFGIGSCIGQVKVVHYNSEWNAENNYSIVDLKDCEKNDVVICHNPDEQEKYDILAVPTLIVFDNGEEKERFNPNIMFQLDADKKTIQHSVDTLILNKFQ